MTALQLANILLLDWCLLTVALFADRRDRHAGR
jgi:hypothetical protein